MPVDVSMYPGPPKPVNPLEVMSNLAALKGQIQQNELTRRTMAGQQAEGQAIQGATAPDGSFNPDLMMQAIRADPSATYAAAQAQAFAQAQRQAQLAQHVQQVELGIRQTGFMADQLGSLADTKGVTGKDVASLAGTLVQNGILDSKSAATELAAMPANDDQLPQYLRGLQKRAMDSQQQLALYHQKILADNGAQLVPANTAPLGDQAPIDKQLSPSELAQPVSGPVTADGAPTTVPLGQRLAMGTVQTAPSPAQSAAGAQYGGQAGNAAAQFEANAREAPAMDAMLKNMKGDLSSLSTGPGSDRRNQFIAGVNGFLGTNFAAEKVSDQESFNKVAAAVVAKQRQMMGLSGTDAQLEAAQHASPGSALSKRGNEANIAIIRGNNDYLMAQNSAWQKAKAAGFGPDKFGSVMTTIQKYVTPLPFQLQHMAEDQREQLLKSMTPTDRAKATQEVEFARSNHLIPSRFDQ